MQQTPPTQRPQSTFTLALKMKRPDQPGAILVNDAGGTVLELSSLDPATLAYRERTGWKNFSALTFTWTTTPLPERLIAEYYSHPENFNWHVTPQHPHHKTGTLLLQAPLALWQEKSRHAIVIRHTGSRLQLFVDGVLLDEEWPQGPTQNMLPPFHAINPGQFEAITLDDASWSDDAVLEFSQQTPGSLVHQSVKLDTHVQYWRPAAWNAYVGDVMPFFHDGTLHVYYLYDRRHHQSKWGVGAHEFAHLSTRDLVHWEEHPHALTMDAPKEGSLGTGNAFFHNGTYYLTWIEHARRLPFRESLHHADNIFVARSTDGVHFTKQDPAEPWLRLDYGRGGDINSVVFKDPDDKAFYQLVGGLCGYEHLAQTHFKTTDLQTWEPTSALSTLGKLGVCPSYLHWRGWHYVYSVDWYYISQKAPSQNAFDPRPHQLKTDMTVPMIVPFSDDRALLVGFRSQQGYAGILMIQELVQKPDGTLGTKWVEEMIPPLGPNLNPQDYAETPPVALGGAFSLNATGQRSLRLTKLPAHYRLTLRILSQTADARWSIRFKGDSGGATGADAQWIPDEHKLELRSSPDGHVHGTKNPHPLGLNTRYPEIAEPFTLDVLVIEDLIDLAFAGCYTRSINLAAQKTLEDALELIVHAGIVTFEILALKPLQA